jgi:hypothetical protein
MLESRDITATISGESLKGSTAINCPHRDVLSLLLWNLVVDELLMGLNEGSYYAVGYADNIAILINGKFLSMVSEVLRTPLGIAQQWCNKTGLSMN